MSTYSMYALPNSPAIADVHRELVARIANIKPPIEKSVYASPYDQAVELRKDAAYLAELQRSLEPVIEAVIDRAVAFTGMRDVSDRRNHLLVAMDDEILSEFKDRADGIIDEARSDRVPY